MTPNAKDMNGRQDYYVVDLYKAMRETMSNIDPDSEAAEWPYPYPGISPMALIHPEQFVRQHRVDVGKVAQDYGVLIASSMDLLFGKLYSIGAGASSRAQLSEEERRQKAIEEEIEHQEELAEELKGKTHHDPLLMQEMLGRFAYAHSLTMQQRCWGRRPSTCMQMSEGTALGTAPKSGLADQRSNRSRVITLVQASTKS